MDNLHNSDNEDPLDNYYLEDKKDTINELKRKGAEESYVSHQSKKSMTSTTQLIQNGIFSQTYSNDVIQIYNESMDQQVFNIKSEPIDDDLPRTEDYLQDHIEPVDFINVNQETNGAEKDVSSKEKLVCIPDIKMETYSVEEGYSEPFEPRVEPLCNNINKEIDNFYSIPYRNNDDLDGMIEALESKEQISMSENLELMKLKAMKTQQSYMEAMWLQVSQYGQVKKEQKDAADMEIDNISSTHSITFEDLDCMIWAIELKSPKHRTPHEKAELKKLKARRRSRKCRETMSKEEKELRRKKSREHIKAKRNNMTEEEKEERRKKDREHIKVSRENMTAEQKEESRRKNREQIKIKRKNMSEEEKEERRKKSREQIKIKRINMSDEQKEERRRKERVQIKLKRENMTEEQKEVRRKKEREQIKIKRDNMTEEEKEERRKREREQLKIRRRENHSKSQWDMSMAREDDSERTDLLFQHAVAGHSGSLSWNNLALNSGMLWPPTTGFSNNVNLL